MKFVMNEIVDICRALVQLLSKTHINGLYNCGKFSMVLSNRYSYATEIIHALKYHLTNFQTKLIDEHGAVITIIHVYYKLSLLW